MIFSRPHFLMFIWIVPFVILLYVYGMKRRASIIRSYSSKETRHLIVPGVSVGYRRIKAALLSLSLLFIILSLSGMQYGYRWQEIKRRGIDITVALDCSKSMLASDIKPTRLERAKREVYDLLDMLQGDRIGLVAFSGTAFLQCPLTIDYNAYRLFLNELAPDYLPVGGTNLSEALNVAMGSFDEKSNSEKAIILITDGENTESKNPLEMAKSLAEKKIKLFCIGVGDEKGAPIPLPDGGFQKDRQNKIVLSKLDESTLQQMALLTGGKYVRSLSGDMDLDIIYSREIRGKMDMGSSFSGQKKVPEDRFQWPLMVAVLFIFIELVIPSLRKGNAVWLILCWMLVSSPSLYANPLKKGMDAYDKGEYDTALQYFLDAQVKEPEKEGISYNLGNVYYKKGDFDSAYSHYLKALESEDKKTKEMAQYNLGNTSFRKGDLESALNHYNEALALNPDDIHARENMEFVKKEMEKRKKQSQENSDSTEKTGNKDNKESDKPASGDDDDKKKNVESEEKKDQNSNQTDGDKNKPKPSGKNDSTGNDDSKGDKNFPGGETGKTQDISASEKKLDRLKDHPGKAMIPVYQQQMIEKDW